VRAVHNGTYVRLIRRHEQMPVMGGVRRLVEREGACASECVLGVGMVGFRGEGLLFVFFEVVVVGGGIAGSAFAGLLAERDSGDFQEKAKPPLHRGFVSGAEGI